MVIGATTDGNSTVLRTGTMISASLGIGTDSVCAPVETEAGCSLFGDMATSRRFRQSQPNASMHREAADDITPDGQQDAALEPALREFEPMYPGILQLRRQ